MYLIIIKQLTHIMVRRLGTFCVNFGKTWCELQVHLMRRTGTLTCFYNLIYIPHFICDLLYGVIYLYLRM